MLALRPYLPDDYCSQAAQFIVDHPGNVIIVTGFYVVMSGTPETDGPSGAIAIGEALKELGRTVTYVSDSYTTPVLRKFGNESEVLEFPIDAVVPSKKHAKTILEEVNPSLLISIERCGRTREDTYLNMRYVDISPHTARLDYLFDSAVPSVGIGDGGNEIGMGNLADVIPRVDSLPDYPACPIGAAMALWRPYHAFPARTCCPPWNQKPSCSIVWSRLEWLTGLPETRFPQSITSLQKKTVRC